MSDYLVVSAAVALHVHRSEVGAVAHHEDLQRPRVAHRVREHPRMHLLRVVRVRVRVRVEAGLGLRGQG